MNEYDGQWCYDCHEYATVWVTHGRTEHTYCRNCDKGICEQC